jgi:MFS family permease
MIQRTLQQIRQIISELTAEGHGSILFIISTGWFFSVGVRYSYPILLPFFQTTYEITLATAGLLVSVLWSAYALGQFPGGILGDYIGEGNILVISTLLSVLGIGIIVVSHSVFILLAGTIVFGFATAFYGPTRFTILTDIYPERSGTAIGVTLASGSLGNTFLPIAGGLLGTYATWRLGFGMLIPIFLLIALVLWYSLPARTSPALTDQDTTPLQRLFQILGVIRRNNIPTVLLVQIVASFASQGFLSFYPIYLVSVKGFSTAVAATMFGLYFAVGIAFQPISGISQDRYGPRMTLLILLGVYFSSLIGIHFITGFVSIAILTALLSSRNGVGVVTNTYFSSALSDEIQGSGLGLLRTTWILIGAISPYIIGFLADAGYFREAFVFLGGMAGVAMFIAYFITDS